MDVYAFPNLKKGESVGSQIWVADGNRETQVIAGWEVILSPFYNIYEQ
jgi:hypothetical protein